MSFLPSLIVMLAMSVLMFIFTRKFIMSGLIALTGGLVLYLFMPVLSLSYFDGYILVAVAMIICGLVLSIVQVLPEFLDHNCIRSASARKAFTVSAILCGGGLFVLMVTSLVSWSLFRAGSYRELLGSVEVSDFSADTAPVDLSQARVVDQKLAQKLAETKLGEWKGGVLGSTTEVGEMSIQKIGDRLYWVGPLNHSSLFRYLLGDNPPGYVRVSASNANDVELVTELGGESISLRYNMGNYFGSYPQRYLYEHGYATVGMTDFTFEVNDEGRPYWVVTLYEPKVGLRGDDAIGVVTLDAQTGEVIRYGIEDAPTWVDRIQPEELIESQITDWGYYRGGSLDGWLNPSDSGRFQLTDTDLTLVYGKDGRSYWYNGITSVGRDNGTVGFLLVDTRTKVAMRYDVAGATETQAMMSARGTVQEKGYTATEPVLYNVQGNPTYLITLKDNGGFVKLTAFVSVVNFQDGVGIASDVNGAYRNYIASMAKVTRGNSVDSLVDTKSVSGVVTKMQTVIRDGNSEFWFLVDEMPMIFVVTPDTSREAPMSSVGARVRIDYRDGGNSQVTVVEFDNLEFSLQTTPEAVRNDAEALKVVEGNQQ
jgi:hypothetical protein